MATYSPHANSPDKVASNSRPGVRGRNVPSADELIRLGEGQSCEFKESLSSGLQMAGIEALVAFANAQGGNLLFGVRDNGDVLGVQIGSTTLEDLATKITQHTYPSLPHQLYAETVGGKTVLRVEAYADSPPLAGCYLRSNAPLDPDQPAATTVLQAFRRVGRTSQRVDFMLLRQPRSDEPDVVVRRGGGVTRGPNFPLVWGLHYVNNGPGWAYNIVFKCSAAGFNVSVGEIESLPPPAQDVEAYNRRPRTAELRADTDASLPESGNIDLTAEYSDIHGTRWEYGLRLQAASSDQYRVVDRRRRVQAFPSKRQFGGD